MNYAYVRVCVCVCVCGCVSVYSTFWDFKKYDEGLYDGKNSNFVQIKAITNWNF